MTRIALLPLLAACLIGAPAHATVVTFDDLPGLSGVLQNGYGGINWNNNFSYFSTEQRPFTANSGSTRIFANYDLHPERTYGTLSFTFNAPVLFEGLYTSGYNWNPVSFGLYVGGVRVAFSDNEVMPTFTPQYVFSSYSGLIDEVRIYNVNGYAVFDDITYREGLITSMAASSTSAIPEPGSWAMMIAGFALAGSALRRNRLRLAYA